MNAAVDNIIAEALADKTLDIKAITAHVWTENEDGLKWYENRGFSKAEGPIDGYYMKLRPSTAFLIRKQIAGGASVLASLPKGEKPAADTREVPLGATAAAVNLPPLPPVANGTEEQNGDAPSRPPMASQGTSYQNLRPGMEWNDLPADMAPAVKPATKSGASSRSSSTAARKKRDRSYPAAAFGA